MKYIKTDGRPIYKQVITGITLAIQSMFVVLAIIFIVSVVFLIYTLYNDITEFRQGVHNIVGVLGLAIIVISWVMINEWAEEK